MNPADAPLHAPLHAQVHTQVHTRIATLADLDAVAPLFDAYRQFYEQPADLALARHFIGSLLQTRQSVMLVASDNQQTLLGFCQLYPSFCSLEAAPIYTLYDLFVMAQARRRGAGKVLLQAAQRHAAENGRVRMDLTTARSNRAAQSLYASLGWVRDDVFHAYSLRVQPTGGTGPGALPDAAFVQDQTGL